MAAKFEVTRRDDGRFQFRLLAANGRVIATSELFGNKRAVFQGVTAVRRHAEAPIEDLTGEPVLGREPSALLAARKAARADRRIAERAPAGVPEPEPDPLPSMTRGSERRATGASGSA